LQGITSVSIKTADPTVSFLAGTSKATDSNGQFQFNSSSQLIGLKGYNNLYSVAQLGVIFYNTSCDPNPPPPVNNST
jgi:hypothetical protein